MRTESETFGYRETNDRKRNFREQGKKGPKAKLSGTVVLLHFEILRF